MNIVPRGVAVEAAITIASGGQLVKRDAGFPSVCVAVARCTVRGGVTIRGAGCAGRFLSFSYFPLYMLYIFYTVSWDG